MEPGIKIYADFHNADVKGRLRLTTNGTREDLERLQLKLESGLEILLWDHEELITSGVVEFSEEEKIWVAVIDWDKIEYY